MNRLGHQIGNGVVIGLVVIGKEVLTRQGYDVDPTAYQYFLGGCALGFVMTPDLDAQSKVNGLMGRQNLLLSLWGHFWREYSRRYSHRGISHEIGIGTATRWKYAGLRLSPFLMLLWFMYPFDSHLIYYTFLANVLQDGMHLLLDGFKHYPKH